jgi:hypothetical protein
MSAIVPSCKRGRIAVGTNRELAQLMSTSRPCYSLTVLALLFAACGGDIASDDAEAIAESALCTDNGIANVVKTMTGYGSYEATSGTSYDGGACNEFLFQVNNTLDKDSVHGIASWAGPQNKNACATALLAASFYGYDTNTQDWVRIHHDATAGEWLYNTECYPNPAQHCDDDEGTCWLRISASFDPQKHSKVRIGARASSAIWPAPHRVRTTVIAAQNIP